jgi:2-polyprenyl-6-methoxyphenol hydroxylase-like FAD-dependent oxidoreductase
MVWSTTERHTRELLSLPPEAFAQRVAQAGNKCLGELAPLTPPAAFPLRLMRAPHLVKPRLALIGDAAHTIHPLSGHGINLGFKDAQSLATALLATPDPIDCGDLRLLRQYERSRIEEIIALQSATHALQRLFQADAGLLSWLRNTGLNLTNGLPFIKQELVRYALG